MKLIILRHGHTDAIAAGIIQGQTHNELNKLGLEQARQAAVRLRHEHIDIVYCSDLRRTKQTINALLNLQPNLEIIYDPLVRERGCGIYDGHPGEELSKEYDAAGQPGENWRPRDGESFLDLFERAKRWWEVVQQQHPNETVLLVSHGGFIRCLIAVIVDGPHYQMKDEYNHDNTGISVIDIDNSKPTVRMLNNTDHLTMAQRTPDL